MAMLFENHQYRQADQQTEQLEQSDLLPEAKQLVAQYRQTMQKRQAWQADAHVIATAPVYQAALKELQAILTKYI